jgi:hypothetical protein
LTSTVAPANVQRLDVCFDRWLYFNAFRAVVNLAIHSSTTRSSRLARLAVAALGQGRLPGSGTSAL